MDGVYDDEEYRRQKRKLEMELESLIAPEADAASEAGRLIERLPEMWSGANEGERRKLLLSMVPGRLCARPAPRLASGRWLNGKGPSPVHMSRACLIYHHPSVGEPAPC